MPADRLNDAETNRQADAERAMLHALQGHCNSPIAGYAITDPIGRLSLHGKVFSLDGTQWLDSHHWGVPMVQGRRRIRAERVPRVTFVGTDPYRRECRRPVRRRVPAAAASL